MGSLSGPALIVREKPLPPCVQAHNVGGAIWFPGTPWNSSSCGPADLRRRSEAARRNENAATYALGVECQVDLGVQRSRQVALQHQGAEAAPGRRTDRRATAFDPQQLHGLAVALRHAVPRDGDPAVRHRKRAEFFGVARQLVQREPEALGDVGLEQHAIPGNDQSSTGAVEVLAELGAAQLIERHAVPALLDEEIVRSRQRLKSGAELIEEGLDRAGVPRGLP